jgi:hypothetical protein
MKKSLLFLTAIMFVGCNIPTKNNGIKVNLAKEILMSNNRYTVNSCYDEIAEYRFYDKTYNKIFYEDTDFKTIEREINDKVVYKDALNITLYEGKKTLDCALDYDINNTKTVTLYCINSKFKENNNSYHVKRTLYSTKEEALEHSDEDCSN